MQADDELAASLAGLSDLLSGSDALEERLLSVARLATGAIPCSCGAALALREADRGQTVVATSDVVRGLDEVQYRLGEGPAVSAAAVDAPVRSGNLGGDSRWPRFGPRAGRLGFHSALSLPLALPERVLGVLSLYAPGRDAFGEEAVRVGVAFARPAAVNVSNAQLLARSERLAAQLQAALTSRTQIDQAIGVIMGRTGASPAEAFDRLRALSQQRSQKLADVARSLLDETAARTRARHTARQRPSS